ncbi:chemotaxis protein CheW [Methylosinus sp. 3S-1]|nr:chemotaxis protein CheW [Methylosinus sp. 3S-1]
MIRALPPAKVESAHLPRDEDIAKMTQDQSQFVTLGLDGEVFGLPVALVREILDYRHITKLPQAPAYVLGMIDVRGEAVPIIDLRAKLGLSCVAATEASRLIVVDILLSGRDASLGLLVDCVFEVTELDRDAIDPPPNVGGRWRAECIRGIGRRNGAFVVVFDLPRLLAEEDIALMAATGAPRAA